MFSILLKKVLFKIFNKKFYIEFQLISLVVGLKMAKYVFLGVFSTLIIVNISYTSATLQNIVKYPLSSNVFSTQLDFYYLRIHLRRQRDKWGHRPFIFFWLGVEDWMIGDRYKFTRIIKGAEFTALFCIKDVCSFKKNERSSSRGL